MDQKTLENITNQQQQQTDNEDNNHNPQNKPSTRTPTPFVSGNFIEPESENSESDKNSPIEQNQNQDQNDKDKDEDEDNQLKIFIGGLTGDTVDEDLFDYFSQFGTVLDTQIVLNSKTNAPNGFGFVTMKKSDIQKDIFKCSHKINGNNVK